MNLTVRREGKDIPFMDGEKPMQLYAQRPPRRGPAKLPDRRWLDTYVPPREKLAHPYRERSRFEVDGNQLVFYGTYAELTRPKGHRDTLFRSSSGDVCLQGWGEHWPKHLPETVRSLAERELAPWNTEIVLKRYPRVVAHLICESLGYATPKVAAGIIAAALNGDAFYCEWINHCYRDDPVPAVHLAIKNRHHHRGMMAEYLQGLTCVCQELLGIDRGQPFASWF